jgi:osmotically-inducible protein OsmY
MKTSMRLVLIVAGCVLAGCSAQQQQSASHEATQDYHIAQKQSLDAALDVRVSAAIAAQAGVNTFHVAPLAHNGVVTLTGTAPSHEIDHIIVQTVRGVPGVKGVVDHISVRS